MGPKKNAAFQVNFSARRLRCRACQSLARGLFNRCLKGRLKGLKRAIRPVPPSTIRPGGGSTFRAEIYSGPHGCSFFLFPFILSTGPHYTLIENPSMISIYSRAGPDHINAFLIQLCLIAVGFAGCIVALGVRFWLTKSNNHTNYYYVPNSVYNLHHCLTFSSSSLNPDFVLHNCLHDVPHPQGLQIFRSVPSPFLPLSFLFLLRPCAFWLPHSR